MTKALVVGLGMGQQYASWLAEDLDVTVDTVDIDPEKNPTYSSIEDALSDGDNKYDIAYVGTPNFLHAEHVRQLIGKADIILVEKPGFRDIAEYTAIHSECAASNTRLLMVKNNIWRWPSAKLSQLAEHYKSATEAKIVWCTKNRIPSPGSWFTDKSKSYGGVSRDIIPHLISMMYALNGDKSMPTYQYVTQKHTLETVKSTDYGTVNRNGVYDVDDYAQLTFRDGRKTVNLIADWKSDRTNDISIRLYKGSEMIYEESLGLCPSSAYIEMIKEARENIDNDSWWATQKNIDVWIHSILEMYL